jgi:hypothetical protein
MEIEVTRDTWWIAVVIVGVALIPTIYKRIKIGSWKGAVFGAPLRQKMGELELKSGGFTKTKLRVHVLSPREPTDGPHVGIEVVRSSLGSWEMSPVSLTRAEARMLVDELSRAVAASESSTAG